ncbi:hypothetical protein V2J09_017117 [Rumex salicifolius]
MVAGTAVLWRPERRACTLASHYHLCLGIRHPQLRRANCIQISQAAGKSIPPPPLRVNSARVAGGSPPVPAHRSPGLQFPVVQRPVPVESKAQCVRAQKRPDQPREAWRWREAFGGKGKPPPLSCSLLPERIPGQIVYGQRLRSVKTVVAEAE